jgi:hypothetical protein
MDQTSSRLSIVRQKSDGLPGHGKRWDAGLKEEQARQSADLSDRTAQLRELRLAKEKADLARARKAERQKARRQAAKQK